MYHRAALLALLASMGCAVRRPSLQTYRLLQRDAHTVLVPPGMAGPDVAQRTFTTDIAPGRGSCAAAADTGIRMRKKRLHMQVTVARDWLAQKPAGWLSDWADEIEARGCVAPGDGPALAAQIAESLPLDLNATFRLQYRTAQGEISAQTRVQVVRPILREGTPPDTSIVEQTETSGNGNSVTVVGRSTANLIGYETAWYAVEPKSSRIGYRIAPLFAERNIGGSIERRVQPDINPFVFPPEAAFYRLFNKADPTGFTALVIAARTHRELEVGTRALETGEGSCEKLTGGWCIAIPKADGVNLFQPVSVNGSEVLVTWGGTVAAALRAAGERQIEAVLPRLSISKPYHGRLAKVEFDPTSPAILSLILTGGEVLSWK